MSLMFIETRNHSEILLRQTHGKTRPRGCAFLHHYAVVLPVPFSGVKKHVSIMNAESGTVREIRSNINC